MKTAIIFYGFFRTFEYVKQTLKDNVLDPLNCDVFFHSFETINAKIDDNQDNAKLDKVDDKIIIFFGDKLKKYELVPHEPNKDRKFLLDNNLPTWNEFCQQETYRIVSMLNCFSKSLKLFQDYCIKNNENYDLVILARPDIKYHTKFDISVLDFSKINCPAYWLLNKHNDIELKNIPDKYKYNIELRKRKDGAGVHGFNRWLNDNILCGTQSNMLKISNVSDKILEYVNENICFNNETFIGVHMLKNNIEWTGTDFITYELWRYNSFKWPTSE